MVVTKLAVISVRALLPPHSLAGDAVLVTAQPGGFVPLSLSIAFILVQLEGCRQLPHQLPASPGGL